jgi:hypothetical protein
MEVKPQCMAAAIGSMPHSDPARALDIIFDALREAPMWPQLPRLGLREQMEVQYSEGLPRVVIDEAKGRMFIDTSGDYSDDLANFYEGYLTAEDGGNCSAGAISPAFAAGIPAMEQRLQVMGRRLPFVKCQTTGPISFALTIADENKRAIYYNEEFVDAVVKGLALKCRWQIQKFKPFADHVLCFIDEPILAAFGSSTYVSVQRADVIAKLGEVIAAVHQEGALAGVHCCGNTDWSLLVDAEADVLSFDAFEFGETVALYPEHMRRHLSERRNALAWGIVPTKPAIRQETVASLLERFQRTVDHLAKRAGVDVRTVAAQAFLTPSCGTGTMETDDADRVFKLLAELTAVAREKYGF